MVEDQKESLSFEQSVIGIISGVLRRRNVAAEVNGDTDLFSDRLLDSVSFAELLATLEAELDLEVPDHLLSTEHFRTPSVIAKNFGPPVGNN